MITIILMVVVMMMMMMMMMMMILILIIVLIIVLIILKDIKNINNGINNNGIIYIAPRHSQHRRNLCCI